MSGPRLPAPPALLYEPLLRRALREDLGRAGDVTTDAVVPADQWASAAVVARRAGRVAGLEVALRTFTLLDAEIEIDFGARDGEDADAGAVLARVNGAARPLLTGERVMLNLLGRLCGIATVTRDLVAAVRPHAAKVVCTRKTTPGLRALEKYAVRCGGGENHRFGLDDAVLIKDNHVAIAGSVGEAIARVRRSVGHMLKVECEVDSLDQLEQALAAGVDAVLLDNMDVETLRQGVAMARGRAVSEASGGITPQTIAAVAATGVDLISVGWLTHSAPALDVAFDIQTADFTS